MNLDPLRNAAADVAYFLSSALSASLWMDQNQESLADLLIAALAGIASAIAVALALTLYFRTGYRSPRDMVRHDLATAIGLALLAFESQVAETKPTRLFRSQ
jgi:hypothetical protein